MTHEDDEPVLLPFRRPAAGTTCTDAATRRLGAWHDDPEMDRLTRWLAGTPNWPCGPFDLVAPGADAVFCVRVLDPRRYREALMADAARGPQGAHADGLRANLRRLHALFGRPRRRTARRAG